MTKADDRESNVWIVRVQVIATDAPCCGKSAPTACTGGERVAHGLPELRRAAVGVDGLEK